MMPLRRSAVLVPTAAVLFFVATGCSQAGTDKLTVVVEADRARAAEDQARLADMQKALDQAKQELVDTRKDIGALRTRLLATGAITADEAHRLEEREKALAARESGLPVTSSASSPSGGLTRADVEELLRAQEERLRGSLASPSPPSSPPLEALGKADEGPQAAQAALSAAAKLRAERGLRPDDVAGGPALERRANDAIGAKHYGDAADAAKRLLAATEATVVNVGFVRKKYERANTWLSSPSLSAEGKAKVKKLLGQAVTAIGSGDAESANEAINTALETK